MVTKERCEGWELWRRKEKKREKRVEREFKKK